MERAWTQLLEVSSKGMCNMGEKCGEWIEFPPWGEAETHDPCPPDLEDGTN